MTSWSSRTTLRWTLGNLTFHCVKHSPTTVSCCSNCSSLWQLLRVSRPTRRVPVAWCQLLRWSASLYLSAKRSFCSVLPPAHTQLRSVHLYIAAHTHHACIAGVFCFSNANAFTRSYASRFGIVKLALGSVKQTICCNNNPKFVRKQRRLVDTQQRRNGCVFTVFSTQQSERGRHESKARFQPGSPQKQLQSAQVVKA